MSEENMPVNEELTPTVNAVEEVTVEVDPELLGAAIDGLLLVQNRPVTLEKLAAVLGISLEKTEEIVHARKKAYDEDESSGLQIAILENGIQLATRARVSPYIQRLDGQKLVSLSLPALETLAVIAFKQPITKAEIDAIRGVNCDGVVSTLLEKKLIYVSGEKQVLGKPRLYSTTQDFLYYFGMKSLKELPVPSIDIPEQLTPEGQKAEASGEHKQVEKDFNDSQGLMPITEEENDNSPQAVNPENDGSQHSDME
ncbi:MAG: SMC-Scp complex subunit ScpB [Candidatus Riflebacteria bacterium HGW-Riflebacteria-2]|jgi:segregation and condensation protein B|nr:MAG: SMC-Scp complex subunit ScpB [Candidatus Riflebacteria bacterium HGW-Riflebacteria-2]